MCRWTRARRSDAQWQGLHGEPSISCRSSLSQPEISPYHGANDLGESCERAVREDEPERGATFDKEQTVKVMERAALDLLAEQGILAGLNLKGVCDRAGVNRGLIYHYFGTRRELLRSSLRRGYREVRDRLTPSDDLLPPSQRVAQTFRESLDYIGRWRTIALLVLDDDDTVRIMPRMRRTARIFERGKQQGVIDDNLDSRDYLIVTWSLIYGYALLRESFSRELGLKPSTVDRRFEAMLVRLFSTLDASEPSTSAATDARS